MLERKYFTTYFTGLVFDNCECFVFYIYGSQDFATQVGIPTQRVEGTQPNFKIYCGYIIFINSHKHVTIQYHLWTCCY